MPTQFSSLRLYAYTSRKEIKISFSSICLWNQEVIFIGFIYETGVPCYR